MKNLIEKLKEIEDKRRDKNKKHKLEIILLLLIMWILWWRKSERSVIRFIEDNQEEIKQEFKKELDLDIESFPKRSTIRDTLKLVDYEKLSQIFYEWTNGLIKIEEKDEIENEIEKEWLNADWKVLKWTLKGKNNNEEQNFISLVSLYSSKYKQVKWVWSIETKKESEIPKVREIIEKLSITNSVITLDALHCQIETVKKIIETNNDYVIWAKGNQKGLKNSIKKTLKIEN